MSATDDARQTLNDEIDKTYFQAVLEAARESIDRARSSAELVEKDAASIGTLYAGVVGVSFSVTDHRLPLRGLLPVLFLGAAIVASMIYLSFLTNAENVELPDLHTSPPIRLQQRADEYIKLVGGVVTRRVYALRLSVVALALGVALLPAPFIHVSSRAVTDLDARFPWPQATQIAGVDPSLTQVVLQARVDEVSAQRKAAQAATDENDVPLLVAAAALFGIAAMLLLLIREKKPEQPGLPEAVEPADDDVPEPAGGER